MPVALVAPDRHVVVGAGVQRAHAGEGRPPLGIACAPAGRRPRLSAGRGPRLCLADFLERCADHARRMAEHLEHQEASVERFLELSGDE
jgi:hypothetical protein